MRDHEPVWHVLKATIFSLDAALENYQPDTVRATSNLAARVASKVMEENIFRSAVSGYDIVRERAREYIHDNIASPTLTVGEIAAYVGASRATLYRAFDGLGGVRGYITFVRQERAKSLIGYGTPDRGGITNIAYAYGFSSPSKMGKAFKRRYGVSPAQFGSAAGVSVGDR